MGSSVLDGIMVDVTEDGAGAGISVKATSGNVEPPSVTDADRNPLPSAHSSSG